MPRGSHRGRGPARWWACAHNCFPRFLSQMWECMFPRLPWGIPRPGRAFPSASLGFSDLPSSTPGASVPVWAHGAPKLQRADSQTCCECCHNRGTSRGCWGEAGRASWRWWPSARWRSRVCYGEGHAQRSRVPDTGPPVLAAQVWGKNHCALTLHTVLTGALSLPLPVASGALPCACTVRPWPRCGGCSGLPTLSASHSGPRRACYAVGLGPFLQQGMLGSLAA